MTNQQNEFAPSEDSDQPGHRPSPIRVVGVRRLILWHTHFVGFVMSWLILFAIYSDNALISCYIVYICSGTNWCAKFNNFANVTFFMWTNKA